LTPRPLRKRGDKLAIDSFILSPNVVKSKGGSFPLSSIAKITKEKKGRKQEESKNVEI